MKFEVNMINVQDGDAIILMLEKENRNALIVIDGGYNKYYGKIKRRLEEVLPRFGNKIDLLVCTHYDNDHLSGVENIIEDYHSIIREIWIHKVEHSLSEQEKYLNQEISRLQESKDDEKSIKEFSAFDSMDFVLEAYKDLVRVVEKIRAYGLEDITKEATRGDFLAGFEEFSVISPTKKYYDDYLEELKDETYLNETKALLLEHQSEDRSEFAMPKLTEIMEEEIVASNPCEHLKKSSKGVSATNMVSIVTLLKIDDRKLLFTGDSGIESFTDQGLLDKNIKDLEFLDLSHHGSKYNTSKELLEYFNPETVFVSAKNGKNRPSKNIVRCLNEKRTGDNVFVTNKNFDTWYLKYTNSKNIYRVTI
ncbi:ComEC/Rec2 family competence protein [Nonlabens spongiae]|nr:MBL fold metallo-hydrolase [Nonlabens spongiae]